MLKNYFKVAIRNLLRNKTFSSINILGFAFGISVCLMIVLFLIKEYSYDSYNVNAKHIYKLVDSENNSSAIDYRVAQAIVSDFPEVEDACVVCSGGDKIETSYKSCGFDIGGIMSVDNAFFRIFTTRLIMGDAFRPLPGINSVVLTKSSVHELFGNEDPIGKVITLWRKDHLTVTGVIEDFPENSSFHANMIVNMGNNDFKFSRSVTYGQDSLIHRYFFNIYLQLAANLDPNQLMKKINGSPEVLQPYVKKVDFLSLKEMYLHDNTTGSATQRGNPDLLKLFMGIALIVLLLAIINYMNLSIARQSKRNKETGIRKTIGAGRRDIVALFLTESVLVTFAAFGIALVVTETALPFFEGIVDTHLSMKPLIHFPYNIALLASIILIGITAGTVPAIMLSSYNPINVLNKRIIGSRGRYHFRNLLTVFQFTVSIALVFCIMVVEKQINFVRHENLGFDKDQLLRIDLPFLNSKVDISRVNVLANKLREFSGVVGVSLSKGVPGDVNSTISEGSGKEELVHHCILADSSFINTFNIQIIKGRLPWPGEYGKSCLINETSYERYDWQKLSNKLHTFDMQGGSNPFDVIGVVRDFHISSLHQPIEPTCIMITSDFTPTSVTLHIRKGEILQTMAYLRNTWGGVFPDSPLNYQFYDEWFNQMYNKDERFGNAVGMFAFLAVAISCLGILGMATYSSERRTKEIGIRKVHGATVNDLMLLLNKEFIRWVIVAFVTACPIGWYAMHKWLQDFAYRTEISWWIFVASGLIALAIALLTVCWQTWRASTRNPVEALRYE